MNILKKYIILISSMFLLLSSNVTSNNIEVYASNATIPNIQINSSNNITNGLYNSGKKDKLLNKILTEYRGIIVFISGIAMLSMIMFFIFNFIELGNSKGNPQARQKAISGLIVSGIATAGLGAVTLIVQLFYNMIKE